MNHKEILKAAIEKAEKNGYDPKKDKQGFISVHFPSGDIIFSHDFAKAFWGERDINWIVSVEERKGFIGYEKRVIPSWQYYLQQMVLEENPVKYLEQFL